MGWLRLSSESGSLKLLLRFSDMAFSLLHRRSLFSTCLLTGNGTLLCWSRFKNGSKSMNPAKPLSRRSLMLLSAARERCCLQLQITTSMCGSLNVLREKRIPMFDVLVLSKPIPTYFSNCLKALLGQLILSCCQLNLSVWIGNLNLA